MNNTRPNTEKVTTTFTYDGDGKRIKKTETNGSSITTTAYIGNYYEITGNGTVTNTFKYYYAGGKRIAMRQIPGGTGDGKLY